MATILMFDESKLEDKSKDSTDEIVRTPLGNAEYDKTSEGTRKGFTLYLAPREGKTYYIVLNLVEAQMLQEALLEMALTNKWVLFTEDGSIEGEVLTGSELEKKMNDYRVRGFRVEGYTDEWHVFTSAGEFYGRAIPQ